jgi:Tfp pilus assembly protein PilV
MEESMISTKPKSQRGIVSLVTVMLAAILFSLVVVSMFAVIANEEHQASEADLSNRAYFAAESGVEAGLLQIKTALASATPAAAINGLTGSCQSGSASNNPSGATYTCLKLSHLTSDLQGSLVHDGNSYQVDLSSIPDISKIVISWNKPSDVPSYTLPDTATLGTGTFSNTTPTTTVPGSPGGTWSYPALLEVQSVLFSATTSVYNINDPAQFKIIENALAPTSDGIGSTTEDDSTTPQTGPLAASCGPSGSATPSGYSCSETINIAGGSIGQYKRILRLRSRYANTSFSVQVFNNGVLVPNIPDSYENIDVTAKSGNTYRRVRARVQIQQNTVALDYALFSDTDICHDYQLDYSHVNTPAVNAGTSQCIL